MLGDTEIAGDDDVKRRSGDGNPHTHFASAGDSARAGNKGFDESDHPKKFAVLRWMLGGC